MCIFVIIIIFNVIYFKAYKMRSTTKMVDTIWIFEKEDDKIMDETPEYEGVIIEYLHKVKVSVTRSLSQGNIHKVKFSVTRSHTQGQGQCYEVIYTRSSASVIRLYIQGHCQCCKVKI